MSFEAIKKAAGSSKVLIFLVFAVAITAALKLGMVDAVWYQETIANAFYLLMGGYSLVEVGRAIAKGKVSPAAALEDPKKAMDILKDEQAELEALRAELDQLHELQELDEEGEES